jgi:hypothetical protein
MNDLSNAQSFKNLLPSGTTTLVAYDLVGRLLGEAASPAKFKEAVDYFVGRKNAGASWGTIMFEAVEFLDATTDPSWAPLVVQFKARSDYNVVATGSWAASVSNLGLMRDVYSYGQTPSVSQANFAAPVFLNTPLTKLTSLNQAFTTANSQPAPAQIYTVTAADAGRAIEMGEGNSTVSIDYGFLKTLGFVSGGAGYDTLKITSPADKTLFTEFMNTAQGFFANQPIRGFEKLVFGAAVPSTMVALEGVKEYVFDVLSDTTNETGFGTKIAGLDNDITFTVNLGTGGIYGSAGGNIAFYNLPPYDAKNLTGYNNGGSQAAPVAAVESMTFNVSGAGGYARFPDAPAKNITINVTSINSAAYPLSPTKTSVIVDLKPLASRTAAVLPNLENLTLSSNSQQSLSLSAPLLKSLDLSGSIGEITVLVRATTSSNDGVLNALTVTPSKGLTNFLWDSPNSKSDTYVNFTNEVKAGSLVLIDNKSNDVVQTPLTKVVFGSDFSEINANTTVYKPSQTDGSYFLAKGVSSSAVYFKGTAAPTQKIGTFSFAGDDGKINAVIKVDSANGLDIQGLTSILPRSSTISIINASGQGSVIDNLKASLTAQAGPNNVFLDKLLPGGRALYVDSNANGLNFSQPVFPGSTIMTGGDFVILETTPANVATFAETLKLMGLSNFTDPFA